MKIEIFNWTTHIWLCLIVMQVTDNAAIYLIAAGYTIFLIFIIVVDGIISLWERATRARRSRSPTSNTKEG